MAGEAALYALLLGGVVARITALILPQALLEPGVGGMPLPAQVVLSLGAGFYEEVVFRGLVLGGLRWGLRALGREGRGADAVAVLAAALIFSAYHYVGVYADPLSIASFTFRFVAGLVLSVLLVLRGFGITVLTHALYDVLVALTH
jgi:membrane protease YdiL (CAAX protease family)